MAHIFGSRNWEGFFHLLAFLALACSFMEDQSELNGQLHLGWVIVLVVGSWAEGMRGPQLAFAVLFLLYMANYASVTEVYSKPFEPFALQSMLIWLLNVAAGLHNLHFVKMLGCNDFTVIESAKEGVAPYHVGMKKVKITDRQLEVSVFYPIDKLKGPVEYVAMWFDNPERTIAMMKHVWGAERGVHWIPGFILRTLTQIRIPVIANGRLSERFSSGEEAIRPIIFSHGLSACNTFYTAFHHSMAAHGHLVVAVNHQDKSCFYTENRASKPILYEYKELHCDVPYRKSQIDIRSFEIKQIIDELKQGELVKTWFGTKARVDISQLVLSGHSFGGSTMIKAASDLPEKEQPKALLLMDPWCYPIH